jgi:hypothetical protein
MLRYFLSGFQMGHDLGLGGRWPAGYYLVYCKIIIYIPMYSTCLSMYLRAYLPVMYDSLLIDCLIIYVGVAIYLGNY